MSNPVTIYTTSLCGYCILAKRLLNKRGIPYREVDVSGDDQARAALVAMSGGRTTVPQIFIDGVAIGGYRELKQLDLAGQLAPLVPPA